MFRPLFPSFDLRDDDERDGEPLAVQDFESVLR